MWFRLHQPAGRLPRHGNIHRVKSMAGLNKPLSDCCVFTRMGCACISYSDARAIHCGFQEYFDCRRFIDYEYAGFNPVALDIANHWCEYAADYHATEAHLLDYNKFPARDQQLLFTRAYVAAAVTLKQQQEDLVGPSS